VKIIADQAWPSGYIKLERDDGVRIDYAVYHPKGYVELDGQYDLEELEALVEFIKAQL